MLVFVVSGSQKCLLAFEREERAFPALRQSWQTYSIFMREFNITSHVDLYALMDDIMCFSISHVGKVQNVCGHSVCFIDTTHILLIYWQFHLFIFVEVDDLDVQYTV